MKAKTQHLKVKQDKSAFAKLPIPVSLFFIILCLISQCVFVFAQADEFGDRKRFWTKSQISEADRLKVFNNLWEAVNRLYYDSNFNGRNWSKLRGIYQPQALAASNKIELKRVLSDLLGELNTSHLTVSLETSISGGALDKMFGKGADYKNNNIVYGYGYATANLGGRKIVTEIVKESSAEQAGLKIGWIEKSCQTHPSTKAVADNLVFTEIADCVFTTDDETERNLTLSQSWFLSPRSKTQRTSKTLAGNSLYLKFTEFQNGSDKWLKDQIKNNASAKTIIVDLRDNVGGSIEELKGALSIFFSNETIVGEFVERDSDRKLLRVGSNATYQGQVVVLIDGSSTSAAEIFAAAFQEFGRGKIIGEKSAGMVLNSTDKNLSNGFSLHIAFRDYRTAKGARLEGRGVAPDIEIPFSIQNFRWRKDVALEKTLEILSK